MQTDWIDTFLDLLDTGSFHRSAERLGVGQSTISARIKALESEMGARLLTRSRAGTRPTTAGLQFAPEARAIRRLWQGALQQVRGSGTHAVTVRLGIQHDLAGGELGLWLADLRARLPECAIYLEPDYSTQMCADLETGALDFAVMFTPRAHPDLHVVTLGELRYRMVSTSADSLAQVAADSYIRGNYAPAFATSHSATLPRLADTSLASGQAAAVAGMLRSIGGSAYLPQTMARALAAEGVVRLVGDAPVLTQPVHGAMLLSMRTRRLQVALLDITRRRLATMGASGTARA